jgi:hypothetical protein
MDVNVHRRFIQIILNIGTLVLCEHKSHPQNDKDLTIFTYYIYYSILEMPDPRPLNLTAI